MGLISLLKIKNRKALFTTPSHGGDLCIYHKFYKWYHSDISEVEAYNPIEALNSAEIDAAKVYGVLKTKFLTNGSTSGIIASVLACCSSSDKLLIWNQSHKCHRNSGILANASIIEYELPYNPEWGIYEPLSTNDFENLLIEHAPKAIIITSPTYEGLVSDVKKFAEISKKYNTYLIVDEAHGALYPFSNKLPESAVKYADFTVQSLHKTAGGINPTALLHTNTNLDIETSLAKITTTSPSYPMLATIEANIKFLNSKRGRNMLDKLITDIKKVRDKLTNLEFYGDDITKILIKKKGLTGYDLSEILFNKYNIEDERTNNKSTMLLIGIGTSKNKLSKLYHLIKL